jgi:hypothetical protein
MSPAASFPLNLIHAVGLINRTRSKAYARTHINYATKKTHCLPTPPTTRYYNSTRTLLKLIIQHQQRAHRLTPKETVTVK